MYGGEERAIPGFDGETRGEKPLGRPRHRLENNIKMDLHEVGWGASTGLIEWVSVVAENLTMICMQLGSTGLD
jgi:hypothetical protein